MITDLRPFIVITVTECFRSALWMTRILTHAPH